MMTTLSEADVIESKPIGGGLSIFCDKFKVTCVDLGIPVSADRVEQVIGKGIILLK
jgi:predicted P-loop ATPase/GTPase